MICTEGVAKDIPAEQSIHAIMQFYGPGFPGKLHFLPSGTFDQIVLYQHMRCKKAGNAAYSRIFYGAASHHTVSDLLSLQNIVVPAFISHIDAHCIGPVYDAVFDYPVMPSVTGNGATLGYRCTGCSMGAGDSFYLDIR